MAASLPLESAEPLPMTVEEITPIWLSGALGRTVTSATVNVEDSIHGTGSKLFIDVEYDDDDDDDDDDDSSSSSTPLPTTLCIKGGFEARIMESLPAIKALYRREAEFLYHISSAVPEFDLPPSWYAGIDPPPPSGRGQGLVIMSDLRSLDFTFGDPLSPWPVERMRDGVTQLAALHGKTWGASLATYPWLAGEPPIHSIMLQLMAPTAWAARFDDPAARPPVPDYLVDRMRVVAGFEALWRQNEAHARFRCVLHGDAHVGNTAVSPAGAPRFLDMQAAFAGPAMHDVAYFIAGAQDIEARRQNERGLVAHYLAELERFGAPRFAVDDVDVWDEYRKQHFHGFAWALAPPVMQGQDLVHAMSERYAAAIFDHQSLELIETLAAVAAA